MQAGRVCRLSGVFQGADKPDRCAVPIDEATQIDATGVLGKSVKCALSGITRTLVCQSIPGIHVEEFVKIMRCVEAHLALGCRFTQCSGRFLSASPPSFFHEAAPNAEAISQ